MKFAARFTQGSAEATVNVAANGDSVFIHGIVVSNVTGAAGPETVVFSTTDSAADTLFEVDVGADQTVVIKIPFLADRGFSFVTSAGSNPDGVEVTVFHSNIGA